MANSFFLSLRVHPCADLSVPHPSPPHPPLVCTALIYMCVHVKDTISICRKRVLASHPVVWSHKHRLEIKDDSSAANFSWEKRPKVTEKPTHTKSTICMSGAKLIKSNKRLCLRLGVATNYPELISAKKMQLSLYLNV